MTKITSFLMLAEPERLQYPYAESIASLASFSDQVLINFAASNDPKYRKFEKESHDRLIELRDQFSSSCEIKILLNECWSYQHEQKYDEIRNNIQTVLNEVDDGWFLKCDGDNVFQDPDGIRALFEDMKDDFHLVSFPRIDVINKSKFCVNPGSRDIYAFNVGRLKKDNIEFSISKDPNNWCRPTIDKNYQHFVVPDMRHMPVNYDATFFDKSRLIEFWRKTAEAYETSIGLENPIRAMSDDQVIDDYVRYRRKKVGGRGVADIKHPRFVKGKIDRLTPDIWGFDNFGRKI